MNKIRKPKPKPKVESKAKPGLGLTLTKEKDEKDLGRKKSKFAYKGFYERLNSINVQFLASQKYDYEFTPLDEDI